MARDDALHSRKLRAVQAAKVPAPQAPTGHRPGTAPSTAEHRRNDGPTGVALRPVDLVKATSDPVSCRTVSRVPFVVRYGKPSRQSAPRVLDPVRHAFKVSPAGFRRY